MNQNNVIHIYTLNNLSLVLLERRLPDSATKISRSGPEWMEGSSFPTRSLGLTSFSSKRRFWSPLVKNLTKSELILPSRTALPNGPTPVILNDARKIDRPARKRALRASRRNGPGSGARHCNCCLAGVLFWGRSVLVSHICSAGVCVTYIDTASFVRRVIFPSLSEGSNTVIHWSRLPLDNIVCLCQTSPAVS